MATMAGGEDPATILERLVAELNAAEDPDTVALEIGCGDLESLFHHGHELALWPRIEELAREYPVFRRALRACWAYGSPGFERRTALLEELGEFRSVTLRFVVEPDRIGQPTPLSWRAIQPDPSIPLSKLGPLLRSIADWADEAAAEADRLDETTTD